MPGNRQTPESVDLPPESKQYRDAIVQTAQMVKDQKAQALASKHGLQILNLTWEDAGRFRGSAVGPNISDMTIQVRWKHLPRASRT
jgi:hypothetical protein